MRRTPVVVIGAGQAGLAVSHLLSGAGVDHAVLERGLTAQRNSANLDGVRHDAATVVSRVLNQLGAGSYLRRSA
jgi:2-polyprenyl-6-methoxyphenol hydroxylase-like FAD-dependent oxidoreductase